MAGWRPIGLITLRHAWRTKGRSLLVMVLVALPVLAVTFGAIWLRTLDVSGVEGLERTMGAAEARISYEGGGLVEQAADPDDGTSWHGDDAAVPLTEDEVLAQIVHARVPLREA